MWGVVIAKSPANSVPYRYFTIPQPTHQVVKMMFTGGLVVKRQKWVGSEEAKRKREERKYEGKIKEPMKISLFFGLHNHYNSLHSQTIGLWDSVHW